MADVCGSAARRSVGMILVTGATGNVGRHVVSLLVSAGVAVRALTHAPEAAGLPTGVQVACGGVSDPQAVRRAADGAGAAFVVWPLGSAERAAAVLEALAGRVRRVVYLSSLGVRGGSRRQANQIDQMHADVEDLIERSGVGWTFLRKVTVNTGGHAVRVVMAARDLILLTGVTCWPGGFRQQLIQVNRGCRLPGQSRRTAPSSSKVGGLRSKTSCDNCWLWMLICGTCATSWRWQRSSASPAPPGGCTSLSPRSASRSRAWKPRSGRSCWPATAARSSSPRPVLPCWTSPGGCWSTGTRAWPQSP